MNEHDRMAAAIALCFADRGSCAMEELITEVSYIGRVQAQSSAKVVQPLLLSRRIVPLGDNRCERFVDFALHRDDAQFVSQARYDHQVSLAISSLCTQLHFSFKEAVDEFGTCIFGRGL